MFKDQDFVRRRIFTCDLVIGLLLWLSVRGNGIGYQIGIDSFFEHLSRFNVRYKTLRVTAQAFSKARKKLRYEVIENLVTASSLAKGSQLFKGLRLYALDGSGFCVPDTEELGEHFNKHRTFGHEAYKPQGTLVAAVDLRNKSIHSAMVDCLHGSEKPLAETLVKNFTQASVFVLDRGLSTQNIFKTIYENDQHFVARLRTDSHGLRAFRNFSESLAKQSYVELPNGVPIRLVKVKDPHRKEPIVIGTTLPPSLASRRELGEIYGSRWEVETVFDYIKNLQNIEQLHARDFNGVMQEVYAHFLLHNLTAMTYSRENSPSKGGQVNRKAMVIHFGERILGLLFMSKKIVSEKLQKILPQLWNLAESSRRKKRPDRSYPRVSKQPRKKWNEGKHRTQELQRFRNLS